MRSRVNLYKMLNNNMVNLWVQVKIMQVKFGEHLLSRGPQVPENSFVMHFYLQVTSHRGEE